jgi:hypothetical protein
MHDHTSNPSLAGAVALLILAGLVAAGLAVGLARRRWAVALLAAAIGGGVFQLGHFAEHLAQASYWVTHRDDAPWMTPWASSLAHSFGRLASGTPSFGMEALHLVGNLIFLIGAFPILCIVNRRGRTDVQRPARMGVAVQTVHVLEHVALTATVLAGGPARGLSTGFGLFDPGPGLWTYRVWWHLTINAIGTVALAAALLRWRRSAPAIGPARPAFAG